MTNPDDRNESLLDEWNRRHRRDDEDDGGRDWRETVFDLLWWVLPMLVLSAVAVFAPWPVTVGVTVFLVILGIGAWLVLR